MDRILTGERRERETPRRISSNSSVAKRDLNREEEKDQRRIIKSETLNGEEGKRFVLDPNSKVTRQPHKELRLENEEKAKHLEDSDQVITF